MAATAGLIRELHRLQRLIRDLKTEIDDAPRLLKTQQGKLTRAETNLHDAQLSTASVIPDIPQETAGVVSAVRVGGFDVVFLHRPPSRSIRRCRSTSGSRPCSGQSREMRGSGGSMLALSANRRTHVQPIASAELHKVAPSALLLSSIAMVPELDGPGVATARAAPPTAPSASRRSPFAKSGQPHTLFLVAIWLITRRYALEIPRAVATQSQ